MSLAADSMPSRPPVWERNLDYALDELTVPAEYAFPNDEQESERLDMQHAMMTHLIGDKLFWSPIGPDPQSK